MADDVLRHLFLGFIRLHILYHAEKESICGVDLMEELGNHGYHVGPGTMYPTLRQLQLAGLLVCNEQIVAGKRRKNFRITTAGKRLLAKARTKLRELAGEVLEDDDARTRSKS
jgi:PadR family transcriptional regulator, regulatory protein PadR